ncbi:MAG: hypothetical protein QF464_13450, partial [Myxococcota bacterium]|nr:hypothetical protein [Myxococcota bacterium]
MRRWWMGLCACAAILALGCSSGAGQIDGEGLTVPAGCDTANPCPDDLVCVAGQCVAPSANGAADVSESAASDGVASVMDAGVPRGDGGPVISGKDDATGVGGGDGFGELGDPCDDPEDCYSGLCAEHMGDEVCTKTCDEDCPDGWACKPVAVGGDVTYICVYLALTQCDPCLSDD